MRTIWLIISFIGIVNSLIAQDAISIMQKSYQACQAVKNGSYEMSRYFKPMTRKDTSKTDFHCVFEKLPEDSLFGAVFHFSAYYKEKYSYSLLYTGEYLVNYNTGDSTGTSKSKTQWADEIKSSVRNYKFYDPIIRKKSSPLMQDSLLFSEDCKVKFVGVELLNLKEVFHIQINWIPDSADAVLGILRNETHIWINSNDYLPLQYSTEYDIFMNNDTMFQFEKNVLNKYELNHLNSAGKFEVSSIPEFITVEDYMPHSRPELLAVDGIAPDFELLNLADGHVKLTDLKGKVVMIDFFYKSCYPCMRALPALQKLHEKYKDQGLVILGINPFDKKEDDIGTFLEKRGITFQVLLEAKLVSSAYNVSGYPTTYIIDKNGKIALAKSGYGEGVEDDYEKVIINKLAEPYLSKD